MAPRGESTVLWNTTAAVALAVACGGACRADFEDAYGEATRPLTCSGQNENGSTAPHEGTFEAIAASGTYSCAIRTEETVTCWGSTFNMSSPPDGAYAAIAAGCGIMRDDLHVHCWSGTDFL